MDHPQSERLTVTALWLHRSSPSSPFIKKDKNLSRSIGGYERGTGATGISIVHSKIVATSMDQIAFILAQILLLKV